MHTYGAPLFIASVVLAAAIIAFIFKRFGHPKRHPAQNADVRRVSSPADTDTDTDTDTKSRWYHHDPERHAQLIQANRYLSERATQEFSSEIASHKITLELKEYTDGDHGLPGMTNLGDFEMHARIHMRAGSGQIDFGVAWSNIHEFPVHFLYNWAVEGEAAAFLVAAASDRDFAKVLHAAHRNMELNLRAS